MNRSIVLGAVAVILLGVGYYEMSYLPAQRAAAAAGEEARRAAEAQKAADDEAAMKAEADARAAKVAQAEADAKAEAAVQAVAAETAAKADAAARTAAENAAKADEAVRTASETAVAADPVEATPVGSHAGRGPCGRSRDAGAGRACGRGRDAGTGRACGGRPGRTCAGGPCGGGGGGSGAYGGGVQRRCGRPAHRPVEPGRYGQDDAEDRRAVGADQPCPDRAGPREGPLRPWSLVARGQIPSPTKAFSTT